MAIAQIPKSVVASKMNMTRVFNTPAINKTMDGTLSLFVAGKTPKMGLTLPPIKFRCLVLSEENVKLREKSARQHSESAVNE